MHLPSFSLDCVLELSSRQHSKQVVDEAEPPTLLGSPEPKKAEFTGLPFDHLKVLATLVEP